MKKELKDYLHFYRGCTLLFPDKTTATLIGSDKDGAAFISDDTNQAGYCSINSPKFGKPILRPMSSMADDEKSLLKINVFQAACLDRFSNEVMWTFDQVRILLSLHFDIFDLIPSGLAIDAETITTK